MPEMTPENQPVLIINCGSSSIKYALIENTEQPRNERIEGLAENLGTPEAKLSGHDKAQKFSIDMPNAQHTHALQAILARLGQQMPMAIGHRVVHGGEFFNSAQRIDADILQKIRELIALAPLHNPANVMGIEATLAVFPHLPQVAVFDTAFHHSMPPKAYRYALPELLYTEQKIRRYGFHGTSHAYVTERASTLNQHQTPYGWLSAHLGNGCSTCAVWNGQSVDTSMGLTPLEGLVMGTRSGDVDPGLHGHLQRVLGWDLPRIDKLLNKESGLLGLSGLSNDMRTLEQAVADGHAGAQLAIAVFCYRLAKSLAALSCGLPVLHGIIFTGGIGENSAGIRAQTIALLPHFQAHLDTDKNDQLPRGQEGRIDTGAGLQLWVIPTDEEGRIAAETRPLIGL